MECPNTSFYLTNLIQTSMVLGFEKKSKACRLVLTRIDEKTPGANMLPCFSENASSRAKLHDQNLGFQTITYSQWNSEILHFTDLNSHAKLHLNEMIPNSFLSVDYFLKKVGCISASPSTHISSSFGSFDLTWPSSQEVENKTTASQSCAATELVSTWERH